MSRITLKYDSLKTKYGVRVLQDRAMGIDPVGRQVSLAMGPAYRTTVWCWRPASISCPSQAGIPTRSARLAGWNSDDAA